ncbi:MAG TPA: BatA domain-containing protein [Longimicrobiales bacterium]|nr:BatA domain-containing protein [Longimicrobiales bacterium]
MSLAFLVPLFLLGVAAVVVPIVVHLTRRQRRNVVRFPSLMFLEKIPFQEQRRRRIQHWFLLSLRALALTLLAVAFARPFLEETELGLGASSGPREIVVLLDQSYSMEVDGHFERAREEARSVFAGLGPLDRASLVVFSQGARVLVRSTSDRARLQAALDTVDVGSGSTRYGPALKVAQTILEESTLPAGEVYMFSDFQRNGWVGDEGVRLPVGSKFTPVALGHGELEENLLVTDVLLPHQIVSGRERVTPSARVVRRGGSAPREVAVSLEIDGQEIQQRTVTLQPDAATSVAFQPVTLSRPHTRGTVRLPDDALTADNTHHFVLSPGTALSVLILEGPGARRDASLYLRRALEITEDGRFEVEVRRASGVRAADLTDVDAVILNDVQLDGASAERLRTFVEEGGGLLVASGEESAWPSSAADLLPGALGPVQDRISGRGARLGFLEYGHAIFEVFAGPRSGDFTGARFYRARAFEPAPDAAVLARFDDGSVALAERRVGRGRVLVWTSSLDSYWTDFALQPVYLPFVHRTIEHLGGRAEARPWFTIGQVVDLANPEALVTAGLVSSEASGLAEGLDQVALTPSGSTIHMPAGEGPRYLPLEEHGFYVVRPPASEPPRPFVIAVNVDIEESNLARLDPEQLSVQIMAPPGTEGTGFDTGEALALQREDQERRQSLWRWLLLAALGLFITETVLSNWVSRRAGGAPARVSG